MYNKNKEALFVKFKVVSFIKKQLSVVKEDTDTLNHEVSSFNKEWSQWEQKKIKKWNPAKKCR